MRRQVYATPSLLVALLLAPVASLPAQRLTDLRVAHSSPLAAAAWESPAVAGAARAAPAAPGTPGGEHRRRECNPVRAALFWGVLVGGATLGLELGYFLATVPLRVGSPNMWAPDPLWAGYAAGGAALVGGANALHCRHRRGG